MAWRMKRPQYNYFKRNKHNSTELYTAHGKMGVMVLGQQFLSPIGFENIEKLPLTRNPFIYWVGQEPRANWATSWGFRIPAKLRKVPLNLIYKDLVGEESINFEKTVFYPYDFDAF